MEKYLKPIALFITFYLVCQGWAFAQNDPFRSSTRADLAPFYHGVASGDPLQDGVMLWTRVTTDSVSVDVDWRIATDTGITNIIVSGTVTTDDSRDYTVKVDVDGLQPNTFYYYEFSAYGENSVRGRTKTLPVGDVDSLRFAIVSCSNYAHGYFNAYDRITERNDIDAVLHLGDYIYEYGDGEYGDARPLEPSTEITSLADYRMRHSQYKLDEDLMRLHQQYPFINVWDDHESANDAWFGGAGNHDSGEGDWFDRKSVAIQAYYEWLPIRHPDSTDTERIYRKFRFGDLLDLYMLDTRLEGREQQDGTSNTSSNRTLLGSEQFDWLTTTMDTSTAQWQVLGQQVMMAPLNVQPIDFFPPIYANEDQWDGYSGERQKLYDSLFLNSISNMVVLTGDIHTSWANDLPLATYSPGNRDNSAGVEFVVTSVTSTGFPFAIPTSTILDINDHMRYANLTEHGYMILDVNKTRAQANWYYVNDVDAPNTGEYFESSWYVNDNERFLRQSGLEAEADSTNYATPAPLDPREVVVSTPQLEAELLSSVLLGAYPNPFNNHVTMHYTLNKDVEVEFMVYDALGRTVWNKPTETQAAGMHRNILEINDLPSGTYVVVARMGNITHQRILVKQ